MKYILFVFFMLITSPVMARSNRIIPIDPFDLPKVNTQIQVFWQPAWYLRYRPFFVIEDSVARVAPMMTAKNYYGVEIEMIKNQSSPW